MIPSHFKTAEISPEYFTGNDDKNNDDCSSLPISAAERFIEKVLKNVGRQHVDVDQLTPHDLDQLSRLIVDALQVVDQDQGPSRSRSRVRQGPRDLGGDAGEGESEGEGEEEEEERLLKNAPTLNPRGADAPAELQGNFTVIHSHFCFLFFIQTVKVLSRR